MKHTAQLPTTLAGEKYFIVEGLMDDVITLAANTHRLDLKLSDLK